MKLNITFYISVFVLLIFSCSMEERESFTDEYDIVWETKGQNELSAMPLGNGNTGVNLWVEEDGDLLFYLVRNDSFSETSRLLKLGRVRVSFDDNPFSKGFPFQQKLSLKAGLITITAGKPGESLMLSIFCDQKSDVIYITGKSETAREITIELENWRHKLKTLTEEEVFGTRMYKDSPMSQNIKESADVFVEQKNGLAWYHHNTWSPVKDHIQYQNMSDFKDIIPDPILNRTSGAEITGNGFVASSAFSMRSNKPLKDIELQIITVSSIMDKPQEQFSRTIQEIKESLPTISNVKKNTASWWNNFWEISYVLVDEKQPVVNPKGWNDSTPPSQITQAYLLARYLTACQSRNEFPLHFQGGMYIQGNQYMAIPRRPKMNRDNISPDFCFHGSHYWWQNVRLVYHPLFAQGDKESLKLFFNFYLSLQSVFESIAKVDYGADGLLMRETITVFGLPSQVFYGWDTKQFSNAYTKDMWQQTLELSCMMLDYFEYWEDEIFLREKTIPFALQSLRFFDSRFPKTIDDKIRISPSHAVETYWHNVVNDMPTVAGLHSLCQQLESLGDKLSKAEQLFVYTIKNSLPELPIRNENGVSMLDHAQSYNAKRSNYEAPSLYGVFPFRQYAIGLPDLNLARESFKRMANPGRTCWFQTGIFAARLGFSEEAKKDILERSKNFVPNFRFPGYFNSPFDSPPDMDGPGNMQMTLQEMIMQTDGDKIYLLGAWPLDWDASFKLHAPLNTIVQGQIKNGQIHNLQVIPKSRRKDIIMYNTECQQTIF